MQTMTIVVDATDFLMYGAEFAVREAFWRAFAAMEPEDLNPKDRAQAEAEAAEEAADLEVKEVEAVDTVPAIE